MPDQFLERLEAFFLTVQVLPVTACDRSTNGRLVNQTVFIAGNRIDDRSPSLSGDRFRATGGCPVRLRRVPAVARAKRHEDEVPGTVRTWKGKRDRRPARLEFTVFNEVRDPAVDFRVASHRRYGDRIRKHTIDNDICFHGVHGCLYADNFHRLFPRGEISRYALAPG